MSLENIVPYTYYIYHRPTGKKYYGVKYGKKANPEKLWKTYFSSSKRIKKLIQEYGKDSFDVEIRKTFNDKNKAFLWETNVLRRLKVEKRNDWLNVHANTGRMANKVGDKFSEEHKKNISKALKGKVKSENHREKIRNPSLETRKKISEALKGKVKKISEEGKEILKKTQFKKGMVPWNKGIKNFLGSPWNKGKKGYKNKPASEERKAKISKALKGNKNGCKKVIQQDINKETVMVI